MAAQRLLRSVDIGADLLTDPANWVPSRAWTSQCWILDLQLAGGLKIQKLDPSGAAVAIVKAASAMPRKTITKADTIALPDCDEGTWPALVLTRDLVRPNEQVWARVRPVPRTPGRLLLRGRPGKGQLNSCAFIDSPAK